MRRRFGLYLFSLLFTFFSIALLILSMLGILNLADAQISRVMDYHMENTVAGIQHDADELAAYALAFSGQMTEVLEKELDRQGVTFADLEDNGEALTALQEAAYQTVCANLQLAPCSGAFYVLNTTCNSSLDGNLHNGLYLKFVNLYSENTIHNKVCLYRGAAFVAREHKINLHSTWRMEMDTDTVHEIAEMLEGSFDSSSGSYSVTGLYGLYDSWERVRFLCVPVLSAQGQILGVCGFEISSLYFQLSNSIVDKEYPYVVCGMFDQGETGYIGQFGGNQSGYVPSVTGPLQA